MSEGLSEAENQAVERISSCPALAREWKRFCRSTNPRAFRQLLAECCLKLIQLNDDYERLLLKKAAEEKPGVELADEVERCDGVWAEGWREGCEFCLRRIAPRPATHSMMEPPPIIAFWCEFMIESGEMGKSSHGDTESTEGGEMGRGSRRDAEAQR